ncbi:hypothetical protein ACLMAL_27535 [Nocardia sp. CWNU-33]|uniref:hypothetical protein n=1 Tax=Nocardia sp. CWNU-33 TaxID=3392117 RepID=UPI00398E5757
MNFGSISVSAALGMGMLVLLGVGVVATVLLTNTGWALRTAISERIINSPLLGMTKPSLSEAQS